MTQLATMFATFVAFVSGAILITETLNRLFNVQNHNAKLIISWVLCLGLSALAFWQQWGFFSDCGTPDMWQGWVKAGLIGFGCALAANNIYDRDEIWNLLELIFGFFKKKKV